MLRKKIPVARILIVSSWAVPLITAAGTYFGIFLQGRLLLASLIFLSLAASVILAALLRMSANVVQMVFDIQNVLQYSYREHSEMLSSLSANVQSIREEETGTVAREINARLLSCNVETVEILSALSGRLEALHKEGLKSCLEYLEEIKNNCAQVSCDTRDISSFFGLMEKHLNMKKE